MEDAAVPALARRPVRPADPTGRPADIGAVRLHHAAVIALALIGLAAGCTTTEPSAAGGATHTSTPSTPATGGAATTPPGDDRQGDPVRGIRTVTGRVERIGGCTTLVVEAQRWALVGPVAISLKADEIVQVTGHLSQEPAECSRLNPTATLRVTRAGPAQRR
jgi:hypothetical protein